MAVYVDPIIKWGGSATFRWENSCHLFADTVEELHAMAIKIGLKREWFQDKKHLQHYDLTESKRLLTIKYGCIELDRYASVMKWRELRGE